MDRTRLPRLRPLAALIDRLLQPLPSAISFDPLSFVHLGVHEPSARPHDYEIDIATSASVDYVVDDSFLPEQPGARCHRRCLLLRGGRRRLGVVRRLPGRRPCLFDRCCFCASLLKASLFNLCLYSDIVASAHSFVFKLMYSSPRGPWLVI
ncbi:hypothetical protein ACQJBY_009535 [Aegilops geniculata]